MTQEQTLTAGQILALERRSNMTDDEALRYGRSVERAILARLPAASEPETMEEIHEAERNRVPFKLPPDPTLPAASEVDTTLPFEQALAELVDKIVPGLDTGNLLDDAKEASGALDKRAASEAGAVPKKLWLWKNFSDGKQEYWAFDNPYPVYPDSDDPQTLGEPCGYALFKQSRAGRAAQPATVAQLSGISGELDAQGERAAYEAWRDSMKPYGFSAVDVWHAAIAWGRQQGGGDAEQNKALWFAIDNAIHKADSGEYGADASRLMLDLMDDAARAQRAAVQGEE